MWNPHYKGKESEVFQERSLSILTLPIEGSELQSLREMQTIVSVTSVEDSIMFL